MSNIGSLSQLAYDCKSNFRYITVYVYNICIMYTLTVLASKYRINKKSKANCSAKTAHQNMEMS